MDDAGIRMLDSIREVFDILYFDFDMIGFNYTEYNNFKKFSDAIQDGKCPVVGVPIKLIYPDGENNTHAMVATGIRYENRIPFVQLKNSYADNPNENGKVHNNMILGF